MSTSAEQTTVARPVSKEGIGLHTGAKCALTLLPAEADAGIVFLADSGIEIPATVDHVVATERCTTLGRGQARIGSVEHLLAALFGLGFDNVRVRLQGPEVPAADGSAAEWVSLLRRAGRRSLGVLRQSAPLPNAVWVGEREAWAVALPAGRLFLAVGVEFAGTVVGRQTMSLPLTRRRFATELAPARTFAFAQEVEALRAGGLARGGGEENAFAVGPEGYSGPLRFSDEVVRHKALDLVGDLALCGCRLRAHVVAVRPSHRTNVALAAAVRAALSGRMGTRARGEETGI